LPGGRFVAIRHRTQIGVLLFRFSSRHVVPVWGGIELHGAVLGGSHAHRSSDRPVIDHACGTLPQRSGCSIAAYVGHDRGALQQLALRRIVSLVVFDELVEKGVLFNFALAPWDPFDLTGIETL
jgi:hypothetical protein